MSSDILLAVRQIESAHMTEPNRRNRETMLEDLPIKWIWERKEIHKVRRLYYEGLHPQDIAKQTNIEQLSIELFLWWQLETGKLKPRKGGVYGDL